MHIAVLMIADVEQIGMGPASPCAGGAAAAAGCMRVR